MTLEANDNGDAHRLTVELTSLYVACDDCGHSRILRPSNFKAAADLGVHTYLDLCRKIRCGECPPVPPKDRNLTLRPIWAEECDQIIA